MIASKTTPQYKKSLSMMSNTNSASNPSSAMGCVIDAKTSIEGNFDANDNMRLEGQLKGNLSCSQRLVIGQTGKVNGTVQAMNADISGYVEGDIIVGETLILRAAAYITGNITAKYLTVESGAQYNGKCEIGA